MRDGAGNVLGFADATAGGSEMLMVTLTGPTPYIVAVGTLQGIETDYELSANFPLARLRDAEDGRTLTQATEFWADENPIAGRQAL